MFAPYLQPTAKYSSRGYAANEKVSGPIDYDYCELLVGRIEEAQASLLNDYDDYLHCTFALANLGERGRELMHRVARLSPKYDAKDCDRKFDNCLSKGDGRISLATFVKMAKDAGVDTKRPRVKKAKAEKKTEAKKNNTKAAMEKLNEFATFRYNIVKGKVEVKYYESTTEAVTTGKWMALDDRAFNELYTLVTLSGISISDKPLNSIINNDLMSPPYNPGKEWLESLPAWDESQPDYIGGFISLLMLNDESMRPFCHKYIQKFIVNTAALMYDITDDNQLMPMMVGDENIGKTYFCKNLLPPVLQEYTYLVTKDTPLNKDLIIALSEFFLIIFDEADLTGSNFGTLKAIISMNKTNERAVYDRFKKERKRRTSFIGTTNNENFLRELEGTRRIISIDLKATMRFKPEDINYEGIYAQALYYAKQPGYQASLTKEEVAELKECNIHHVVADPIQIAITDFFRKPVEGEAGEMLSAGQIYDVIQYHIPVRDHNALTQIGKVLRKEKYEFENKHHKTMYRIVRINPAEKEAQGKLAAINFLAEKKSRKS